MSPEESDLLEQKMALTGIQNGRHISYPVTGQRLCFKKMISQIAERGYNDLWLPHA
jgi:hypothetical protein